MPTLISGGETADYTGEHSITFKDKFGTEKNTYTNWHMVPSPRPSVNPPESKRYVIENPGGDGIIDLSEVISGYSFLGQRKGSWTFYILNGWFNWYEIYTEISDFLHNKNMQVTLTDDPNWYYNGRLSVNNFETDLQHNKITIDYDFDPYKLAKTTKVLSFTGTGNKGISLNASDFGRKPVTPSFNLVTGNINTLRLKNPELWGDNFVTHENLSWDNTEKHWMDMIFSAIHPNNAMYMAVYGSNWVLDMTYRQGRI